MPRGLLSLDDLTPDELIYILDLARSVKADPDAYSDRLQGRQIALLFEKPSLRTRISFEVGITRMGGHALIVRKDEVGLDSRESIEDVARTLSRWVDGIVMRTFGQDRIERLAEAANVPVVNALSDFSHPCQGISDLQTIREKKGALNGVSLAYVGDGNNMVHSLLFGCAKVGMDLRVATPPGFEPFPQVVERSAEIAAENGGSVTVTNVVSEAAVGADVLYTDVWTSMGQEGSEDRSAALTPYQVNDQLVRMASDDVIVMHCLPAHRGQEITADVIDGPRSIVWDQAENRLWAQMALLAWLFS